MRSVLVCTNTHVFSIRKKLTLLENTKVYNNCDCDCIMQ